MSSVRKAGGCSKTVKGAAVKIDSRWLLVIVIVVCGCGQAEEAPVVAPRMSDLAILQKLDCFNPVYKLNEAHQVVNLRLSWRHLPSSVLEVITNLSSLDGIDLAGTTVGDEGLAQLKEMKSLRQISLVNTPVTDKGLEHLANFPSLHDVWLSRKTISHEAMEKLKADRPDIRVHPL